MRGAVAKVGLFAYAAMFALAGADAAEIRAVKLAPEGDHTRAVFEISAPLDYKLFEIGNPDRILKPGMFATTTVVLPEKPPVITVPETAVDYTLYGDSVYLITEKKEEDGKTSLSAVRTFVQTGSRVDGRVEIIKGVKVGDKVVAVGQLKLQSGAPVAISTDPAPQIPAQPPRY